MKHIVGFSGGIDSQAAARYVLNRFPASDVLIVNSDAGGNEHPLTGAFVDYYSEQVHPVEKISAIVADIWKTEHFAETKGLVSDAPLDFEEMIRLKGRPPSRTAQFCTEILKLRPQLRWIAAHFGPGGVYAGEEFRRYSGVRRDESQKRVETPWQQWDSYFDCELEAPIFDWSKQMCFDYVQAHGEEINPLYKLGFNRVGCAPCINSSKSDIRAWAERAPEMIDKLRGWEKRTGRTFFAPCVPTSTPGKTSNYNTIDEVVAWAFTKHGGKELLPVIQRPACESKYGLCG